jgi:hypothetical protein
MIKHRNFFCPGATWKRVFVPTGVKYEEKLAKFGRQGIDRVALERALLLCCLTRSCSDETEGHESIDSNLSSASSFRNSSASGRFSPLSSDCWSSGTGGGGAWW